MSVLSADEEYSRRGEGCISRHTANRNDRIGFRLCSAIAPVITSMKGMQFLGPSSIWFAHDLAVAYSSCSFSLSLLP